MAINLDEYTTCPRCKRRVPRRWRLPPHTVTAWKESGPCDGAGLTLKQAAELAAKEAAHAS